MDEAAFQLVDEKKQGDLIAIMNWHSTRIIGGIGWDDTQDIISKDILPVMVINPKMIGNFELFRTTI